MPRTFKVMLCDAMLKARAAKRSVQGQPSNTGPYVTEVSPMHGYVASARPFDDIIRLPRAAAGS